MDVRTKLIELLECAESAYYWDSGDKGFIQKIADHLIDNGVTITPAVPGPSEADPNIMEMCFHNGEAHMKEKVGKELAKIAEHMPCITLAQALAMLEGL